MTRKGAQRARSDMISAQLEEYKDSAGDFGLGTTEGEAYLGVKTGFLAERMAL